MALGRKSKKNAQRLWRPDFREVQALPDTKVIRTGFLINFLAIAVTLAVVVAFLFREYSLQSLSESVSVLETQVAESSATNREILETNKRFRQSSSQMEEVIAFDRQIVDVPALIRDVSGIVPEGMIFRTLGISPSSVAVGKGKVAPLALEVSGRILPSPTSTPSQTLALFQERLPGLPSIANNELETELTRFNRNNEFGFFDFTLLIRIYP